MFLLPARTKKVADFPPDDLVQSLNDMSLVTDRAKRQVITSLTLLVFGARSFFRYSFQDLSFGKDSYRDGVIGKNNTPRPPPPSSAIFHHRARSRRRCELSGAFQALIPAGDLRS